MAYDTFTEQVLFADPKVNVLCNRIYEALEGKFVKATLNTSFCITGTVSRIIQGDPLSAISVIPFITNNTDMFNFCANELPKVLRAKVVKFKDRVQMDYNGVFLEFWFTDAIGTIEQITGFFVQDAPDIPVNIK